MIKIPLVPQWNLSGACVCTSDGDFLYVGSRSINFISFINSENETPVIKCFHTRQAILSLDVDPHWGQKDSGNVENEDNNASTCGKVSEAPKLFVALLQDKSVQIWDFNKGCAIQGHKVHLSFMRYMEGNGPSPQFAGEVLISYMCNRNVLSVDNQDIVVYCVASNLFYRRPMFISSRNHHMTLLKCSPFNENHFAIGTKRGLVLVCDLQTMTTLYTLRGHDTEIKSLSWNCVTLPDESIPSALEKSQENTKPVVIQKQQSKPVKLNRSDVVLDMDEIFDIYDYDYLDNEFGALSQNRKSKNDFSDFVNIEKPKVSSTTAQFDFAEACQSLMEEINALRNEPPQMSPDNIVSLEDCKLAVGNRDNLSSCGSDGDDELDDQDNKQTYGSIVRLVCRTPSSEESVDVDGMDRNKQQNIICKAEVHNSPSQDDENIVTKEILQKLSPEVDLLVINNKSDLSKADYVKSIMPKGNYDYLLASTSIDGTFCIFNAYTGATCDSHRILRFGGKNNHMEISWISPTSLIINNKAGELQLWSMEPPTNSQQCGFRSYKFKETKRRWSQRSVVSFACSPKNHVLWCISSYREISMEDINLNKIKLNYSCVSTNIGAIQECPNDMNKIALGFSDHRIGIIDISKMTPTSIHIDNFVRRIESNVMSLVWSPDCKKIAYGTIEGRIGIINVESSSKQPLTFNSICGKPVYSLSWQDKFIYVVCNERIAVYEDNPNKKDPNVLPNIDNVACISLNKNYLFVGTQKGQLRLYTRDCNTYFQYEFLKSLNLVSRYISDISWSPIATNKLAVVANANSIHILEFNCETADLKVSHKIEISTTKAANACVKWSNRNENYFLTCGFDGAVRVWDLSKTDCREVFIKTYHCPMTCGLFLPTDENIIICSGKSASLELIDMLVEKTETSSSKSKRSSPLRTLDTVKWATKALTYNDDKLQSVDKELKRHIVKGHENSLHIIESDMGSESIIETYTFSGSEDISTLLDKLQIKKPEKRPINKTAIYMKNPLTLLYLTTREINKDAVNLMYSILSSPNSNENKSLSAKLYGTKVEAKEVLTRELKNHQSSEIKGISTLFMSQLDGNLKEEILKCVQSKQLCEWHVSLAPSISYSFWKKCCKAFAEQLIEEGYALQAAVYMLAIHQQQDTIEMLIENNFFKEALLIARIYLQPEDPLIDTISEQWIAYLYTNGNLTGAALLCLLTKQNKRAYECLVKIRNTVPEIERVIRLLQSSIIQS